MSRFAAPFQYEQATGWTPSNIGIFMAVQCDLANSLEQIVGRVVATACDYSQIKSARYRLSGDASTRRSNDTDVVGHGTCHCGVCGQHSSVRALTKPDPSVYRRETSWIVTLPLDEAINFADFLPSPPLCIERQG
jgi:hypothetical protein